jgi:ribosome-binding factor A
VAWDRKERVEALLKEKIAIIVLERLNDPRLGFVTITGVKLSGDKRYAKVLYTVLGTEGQRRTTGRALADAARHVQEQLAPTLRLRMMPELRFTYDESVVKESRMLDLLDDLAGKRRGGPGGAQDSLADAEAGRRVQDARNATADADEGSPPHAADETEDDIDTRDHIDDAAAREGGEDRGDVRGDDDPRGAADDARGAAR